MPCFKNSTLQSWHKIRLQHDWITVLTEKIMKVAIACSRVCVKVGRIYTEIVITGSTGILGIFKPITALKSP
jgi:hypothetical protein